MLETNDGTGARIAFEQSAMQIVSEETKRANETTTVVKKPLDFLLPFAVAANLSRGLLTGAHLKSIVEPLNKIRADAPDEFYLLNFLIAENRLTLRRRQNQAVAISGLAAALHCFGKRDSSCSRQSLGLVGGLPLTTQFG